MIESEPIFDYPFEKHFEASIYAEKPEWSPTLKKGMIRTLIMRAYYRGHEENQKQIDNIVSRVLDTITSKERWGYISQYLTDLCEASPESVLRKLEDELKQPQGLLELFEANDGDFMTSRHYYTNVLWAVEQLVQQKKYVVRALEWLWKVDSYNLKYSISNSPKGVLDIVFCAWINESALSVDKKIELARKAIENYPNAWDVIASKLPQGTNSICSTLNTPKYRKIDEHEELYVHEVNKTYIEYLMMCVDSACTDAEKWNKIIQHIKSYDVTIQNEVFKKLILNCREMCDEEKIKIKNEMRYEIYRHRYYHDADWSISELLYDEYSKKIIACSKPDELTYKDAAIITHMLRDIIPISNIFVKSLHSDQNIKQIQITDFQVGMDGICKLLYYNKGIKIKEYLLNISKMNYSNYSSVISLELNDISLVDEGYIAYSAAGHGFGNEYPRVYFSSGEKIIIKRKENL